MAIASYFHTAENFRALLNNERQNNIDLLRAIAVVSVFIHHAQHIYGGYFPFLGEYGGQFGPQLFFLISGYLISASCQKHSLRDYSIHRIFRIIPAYLFFFIGIGALTGVVNLHRVVQLPWEFLANLLLLQQLFPSALISFDVLHVTWTLTVEVLWYAVAPLLMIGNRTLRWPTVAATVVLSTIWAFSASTHRMDHFFPGITDVNPGHSYLFIGNHFFSQICFFVFGAWIYFQKNKLTKWNPLSALAIGILIFLLKPYYMVFNPIFITGIGIGFFMLAAINSAAIKNKLIFLVSETSYSIYLCHFPIILWVHHGLGYNSLHGVVVSVLITIAISVLSYIFIEKPGMRFGRLLSERNKLQPIGDRFNHNASETRAPKS